MGMFDGFFKTVGDAANQVGHVAGQLGNAVGAQQVVPGMPGSPTVSNAVSSIVTPFVRGQTESPMQSANSSNPIENFAGFMANGTPEGVAPHVAMGAAPFAAGIINKAGKEAKPIANVVSKVVAPDAAKSLFGLEHTQAIQDALQRHGVQDYSQIAGAAHNIYDNIIRPTLSTSPKLIPLDDATSKIVDQMRSMKPGLDIHAAKTAASSVLNDLYSVARGGSPTDPVPTHIDTPSIFNIKQGLNNTQPVKSYFNGNPITDLTDLATVAARNALSKIIQVAHPEIAQATKDYGLMQDAVPSIYKATEQAAKDIANKAPHDPMGFLSGKGLDYLPGGRVIHVVGNALLNSPTGQKVLGGGALLGAGALAATQGKNFIDNLNNNQTGNAQDNGGGLQKDKSGVSSNQDNSSVPNISQDVNNKGYLSSSDLPQAQGDVRLNGDGTIRLASPTQIQDSTGNTIGIDDNSFNKQIKTLYDSNNKQQELIRNNPNNQVIQNQANAVMAENNNTVKSLTTLHDSSAKPNAAYDYAHLITGQTAQALQTLKQTSPNIGDLNGFIDNLQNSLSSRYAGLKQQLGVISSEIKGGNLDVKTKGALQSVLKEVNQQTAYAYYSGINTYIGGSLSPEGTSTGTPPTATKFAPQNPPAASPPQTLDFSNLMNNSSGPQFQNGQPVFNQ